jgi:N-acetylmuramic acid 6-phosphate etherase
MISTAVMIRLGHVYGNQMVNVQPTNLKLKERAQRIIRQTTGASSERAAELLVESGNSVRAAIIMEKIRVSRTEAERLLAQAGGRIREALASFGQV